MTECHEKSKFSITEPNNSIPWGPNKHSGLQKQ